MINWTHIEGEIEDVGHGGVLPIFDRLGRRAELGGVASGVNRNPFRFLDFGGRGRWGGLGRALRRGWVRCGRGGGGLGRGGGGGGGEFGDSLQSNLRRSISATSHSSESALTLS